MAYESKLDVASLLFQVRSFQENLILRGIRHQVRQNSIQSFFILVNIARLLIQNGHNLGS